MTEEKISKKKKFKKYEIIAGITIAFLAAVLAVNDLGAGKFDDDELIAFNEKASAFSWYYSKGVKQNLAEGQRDILNSFLISGFIADDKKEIVEKTIEELNKNIDRYKKEKNEILLGSDAVGKENWAQDIDGKYGIVIGAKEWSEKANRLEAVGDIFDYATLFLQISLVMGAIGIVLQIERFKWVFYFIMVMLGALGLVTSIIAFGQAFSI